MRAGQKIGYFFFCPIMINPIMISSVLRNSAIYNSLFFVKKKKKKKKKMIIPFRKLKKENVLIICP